MEDAHIAQPNLVDGQDLSLFAVFDGHGGSEVAEYCGKYFVKKLLVQESFKSGNYKQALIDTFLTIDKALISDNGKKELGKFASKKASAGDIGSIDISQLPFQAGCTACVVLITKTEIYVANAGDTRAVIAKAGKAKPLSNDHKPDDLNEKRRVERAGMFVEEGRVNGIIAISRAIGDWEYKN